MNKIIAFLTMLCLLIGCTNVSATDELVGDIQSLDNDNAVADTVLGRTDARGNHEQFLFSIRNQVNPEGEQVFVVLQELFQLEETASKPEIAEFYYGIMISAQRKEDLKLYTIEFMVDPAIDHIKGLKIESNDGASEQYHEYFQLNTMAQEAIRTMISSNIES